MLQIKAIFMLAFGGLTFMLYVPPDAAVSSLCRWLKVYGINPPEWLHEKNTDRIMRYVTIPGFLICIAWIVFPWIWGKFPALNPPSEVNTHRELWKPIFKKKKSPSLSTEKNEGHLRARDKQFSSLCANAYQSEMYVDYIEGANRKFVSAVSEFLADNMIKVFANSNEVNRIKFRGMVCAPDYNGNALIIGSPRKFNPASVDLSLSLDDQILDDDISDVVSVLVDTKSATGSEISFYNGDETLKNTLFMIEITSCTISGKGWYPEPKYDGHVVIFKVNDNLSPGMAGSIPKFFLSCPDSSPRTGAVTVLADDRLRSYYRFRAYPREK